MRTVRSSSRLLEGYLPQCMLGYTTPLGRPGSVDTPGPGDPPPARPLNLPPWVWAWRPPWPDLSTSPRVWAWRPSRPDLSTSPPGYGPGDPPGQTSQPPPLGMGLETLPARPLNLPPGYGPGDPPTPSQTPTTSPLGMGLSWQITVRTRFNMILNLIRPRRDEVKVWIRFGR